MSAWIASFNDRRPIVAFKEYISKFRKRKIIVREASCGFGLIDVLDFKEFIPYSGCLFNLKSGLVVFSIKQCM
ncbi:hypothetical protein D7S89_13045 [Trinickia fusca]|uniref:Uncharacterized protein n=1 Tax=Trinickia fusca TaxID=2419777 RepID=A0A494XBN8_9BURK|nr:hypothetical protein D7S89_13045 [Trinickia fusca]